MRSGYFASRGTERTRGLAAKRGCDMDLEDETSIIRRRRTKELNITTNGGSLLQQDPQDESPRTRSFLTLNLTDESPRTRSFRLRTLGLLESPFHGDPLHGGLNSLGSLMGLPIGDTPAGGGLISALNSTGPGPRSSRSPRFDFDEIVAHFPSPRPGEALGNSPSRWTGGTSKSSGVFKFPESTTSRGAGSAVKADILPGSGGDAAGDKQNAHFKKFRHAKSTHEGEDQALVLPSPMSALPSPAIFDRGDKPSAVRNEC